MYHIYEFNNFSKIVRVILMGFYLILYCHFTKIRHPKYDGNIINFPFKCKLPCAFLGITHIMTKQCLDKLNHISNHMLRIFQIQLKYNE